MTYTLIYLTEQGECSRKVDLAVYQSWSEGSSDEPLWYQELPQDALGCVGVFAQGDQE